MSDSISDAEKIRNKRLAKLGGSSSSGDAQQSSQKPSESSSSSASVPTPVSGHNPFTDLTKNNQEATNKTPTVNIKPASTSMPPTSTTTPSKRDAQNQPRPRSQQREPPEAWEDRTLSALFRLSLDPQKTKDQQGNSLYFLSELCQELQDQSAALQLRTSEPSNLETAIVEAASNQGPGKAMDYLLECWKRITRLLRSMKNSQADQTRVEAVQEAKRLCMSYCIFAVTMPALLGQDEPTSNILTQHLLLDPDNDHGICPEFLHEAVSRFKDDDSVKTALVSAVEELSRQLAQLSMNDDYRPYISALGNLVRYEPMVEALVESPNFLAPGIEAQQIETHTLLGPFFQLSPMQGEVASNFFSNPTQRDRAYIANSQNALRMTLQQHQSSLFDIVDRFIKTGVTSREKMLDWFALTVNFNHKRRAMRVDPKQVSSDGFMVNVTVCLDRLCDPFMDATFSKINRIEVEYLRRSPRVDIKDETKINADQATSDEFYAQETGGKNNFISEIFFLTAAAHHYGTEAAQTKLNTLRRELKHVEKRIERFEQERDKYAQSPAALKAFDDRLKQAKDYLEKGLCVVMATEGVLLDQTLQGRAMTFMRYIIVWMMRMVSGLDFPKQTLQLPLQEEQPDVFKCLPEYFLEDVVDHFKFITNHIPEVITQSDELVMFCIAFLSSSEYIKNPGLKAGMVVILWHGTVPTRTKANGVLGNLLNDMDFANKYLLHALIKFFIECESTGTHTQFYDKFSTRYEIFKVIQCIWGNVTYRQQLEHEAKVRVDFFVRFVNLLLNDATFLLDESFTSFHKINSLTKELNEAGPDMDENTQNEKKEALEEAKEKAKNYMGLTLENMSMLKLFTDALADAFTMPEVVQRLADMLDYNLDTLVGPKQSNLKVENREEYRFDPASMLSDLVEVYLNLSAKPSFHLAIARDGRSYKPANFTQAAAILQKRNKKSAEELKRWKKLAEAIEAAKAEDEAEEEDLGEIPDEFLDPLLATLMTDPVILPTSKHVVDRSTIRQMLLSDGLDPFNRAPLKIEDVMPDSELKARIDAFRAEKRGRKQTDAMDTSES